jgi:hypothetical protein
MALAGIAREPDPAAVHGVDEIRPAIAVHVGHLHEQRIRGVRNHARAGQAAPALKEVLDPALAPRRNVQAPVAVQVAEPESPAVRVVADRRRERAVRLLGEHEEAAAELPVVSRVRDVLASVPGEVTDRDPNAFSGQEACGLEAERVSARPGGFCEQE